jgi:hypothetical protein
LGGNLRNQAGSSARMTGSLSTRFGPVATTFVTKTSILELRQNRAPSTSRRFRSPMASSTPKWSLHSTRWSLVICGCRASVKRNSNSALNHKPRNWCPPSRAVAASPSSSRP